MSEEFTYDTPMDDELVSIFIEEAREQLETLDQGLVRLEREPENQELMQGIFRAAHTLKGSSGAMGLRHMAELTHAMEDVLDRIRSKTLGIDTPVADALLQGLDLLRGMELALEEGRREPADEVRDLVAGVVDELHALARGEGKQAQAAADVAKPLGVLPDDEVALLVNFCDDCQMPGIRAFMVFHALDARGDVVMSVPTREEVDEGGMSGHRLLVVVRTAEAEEAIRAAVMNIAEVDWVRAARGAAAAGMSLEMPSREELEQQPRASVPAQQASAGGGAPQVQQTVRVSVEALDRIMNLVGELVLDRTRVAQLKDELGERHGHEELIHELDATSNHLGAIVGELHEQVLQARMLPVSQLFNRFPRLVRDLTRSLGKDVEFIVEGESEQLDRSVIEKLVDPLTHLLRNAVDHGMEAPDVRECAGKSARGTIRLAARRTEGHVLIEICDDGPGIDVDRLREKGLGLGLITPDRARTMTRQEVLNLIFASGLSTAQKVSDVSGRGVGMDVVKRNVESLGGTIEIESQAGQGSTFTLKLPLTLAIVRALIVRVGDIPMALPLSFVEETIKVPRHAVRSVRGRALLQWRDRVVPVVRLAEALPGGNIPPVQDFLQVVVARYADRVVCLAVDGILGHQEIVVKSLGAYLGDVTGLAGATILGNGCVALIVDVGKLFESGLLQQAAAAGVNAGDAREPEMPHWGTGADESVAGALLA